MKKAILYLSMLMVVAISCSKEEDDDSDPNKPNNPTVVVPTEKIIELSTDFGKMYIWLYKQTPNHRTNFLKLADSGFYNNTTFHRIIPGFMIQGGDPNSKDSDPTNDGQGGPGYTIPAEFVDSLKNVRGAVATARLSDAVNPTKASSGSQFFINLVHNTHLDNNYTVFGFVMKGMDVADSIVQQPRNSNNRPNSDIKMQVNVLQKTKDQIKNEYNFTIP